MRILCLCDHGNNRSVHVAHQLKYWGHDVLTAGLLTNSQETLDSLSEWADRIILTSNDQRHKVPRRFAEKVQLWDVGPDVYPRPFNKVLLAKVKKLMQEHKSEYKPSLTMRKTG